MPTYVLTSQCLVYALKTTSLTSESEVSLSISVWNDTWITGPRLSRRIRTSRSIATPPLPSGCRLRIHWPQQHHHHSSQTPATLTYTGASTGMQIVPLFKSPPENLLPGTNKSFNSWHLQYIGVSKRHHKKGIGCALIEDYERLVSSEESFLSFYH